jgi:hypothetical protein
MILRSVAVLLSSKALLSTPTKFERGFAQKKLYSIISYAGFTPLKQVLIVFEVDGHSASPRAHMEHAVTRHIRVLAVASPRLDDESSQSSKRGDRVLGLNGRFWSKRGPNCHSDLCY